MSTRRRAAPTQAVLDATVDLLEEVGYGATTIEGIARRAGVGKQTIYRWWGGSKADLILEAFIGVGPERVPAPDTGSLRGDLLAILEPVFARSADRDRGTSLANRTLMAEAQLDPDFLPAYRRVHESWWGPIEEALRRGVSRGEARGDLDVEQTIDQLLGFAWYRLLLGHRPLDPAVARQLVDATLAGIAPR
ncbi:AcrR family transcriptional regulator [Microbacterium sp. AK009]|uniref:TetR/AcrR family transcriptional regulator n=1 Tax=Microbacterium sp. AK009 TaxID=2723068 RepID=UPI0015C88BEF|nr:TetR/AcrR family transcriptional regulator [Microbacterium sp. AK009]NYF15291.1 AcrR family transcriptional regulator [Microbacterium sp. AK009]